MLVRVKVTPGARRERCEKEKTGCFIIAVKEPAERNAANRRVRELIAMHFKVPIAQVRMKTGARGKTKTFEVIQ